MTKQKRKSKKSISLSWKEEFHVLFVNSLEYIRKHRKYTYITASIFFVAALIGFFFSNYLTLLDSVLKGIVNETKGLDYLELIWFIFSNNITSALLGMVLGVFLGLFPITNSLFNGVLLGYVYAKIVPLAGYGSIWRLIPHGIFELPAVFISLGLGIHIGLSFFTPKWKITLRERFKKSILVFLTVILPLLAIAALIESTFIVLLP